MTLRDDLAEHVGRLAADAPTEAWHHLARRLNGRSPVEVSRDLLPVGVRGELPPGVRTVVVDAAGRLTPGRVVGW